MNSLASNDGDHTPTSSGVETTPPQPVEVDPHHDARRRGERIDVPTVPCPDGGHLLTPLFVEVGDPNVWTFRCSRDGILYEWRAL